MSEPTPRPWKARGRMVNVPMGHLTEMWKLDKYIEGNAEANAEHIVRCVNAFDKLLLAAKAILDYGTAGKTPKGEWARDKLEEAVAEATG